MDVIELERRIPRGAVAKNATAKRIWEHQDREPHLSFDELVARANADVAVLRGTGVENVKMALATGNAPRNRLEYWQNEIIRQNPKLDPRRDYDAIHRGACELLSRENAARASASIRTSAQAPTGKITLGGKKKSDEASGDESTPGADKYAFLVGANPTEKAVSYLAATVPDFKSHDWGKQCELASALVAKWVAAGVCKPGELSDGKAVKDMI